MIHSLEGILIQLLSNELLLAIGPVTLSLQVPMSALSSLATAGQRQKLYTRLVWKESGPQLYGFVDPGHVELFDRLQTVSGVGPKLALTILGHYQPSELARHLQQADAAALSRIPGIGHKTAQRMIVELKDTAWNLSSPQSHPYANDALKALINLGYSSTQAQRMVQSASACDSAGDLGSLITLALQQGA